jgi:hypothetical protein
MRLPEVDEMFRRRIVVRVRGLAIETTELTSTGASEISVSLNFDLSKCHPRQVLIDTDGTIDRKAPATSDCYLPDASRLSADYCCSWFPTIPTTTTDDNACWHMQRGFINVVELIRRFS